MTSKLLTRSRIIISTIFLITVSCAKEQTKADLLIRNGIVWTGDESLTMAESIAIIKDRIVAVGNEEETKDLIGENTEIVDVNGKFITPGFIDSHVHLMMGGNALLSVQLRDVNTKEEFVKRIADFARNTPDGEWILEGNWDHTLWGGELPSKDWIDQYTPNHPVVLFRMDGHMVLANSKALALAGVDKDTPNVDNGSIDKDVLGNLTGILKSNAMDLVLSKIPPFTEQQKDRAIKAAINYFLKNGVTSVHNVDSLAAYTAARRLRDKEKLNLRIYQASPLNRWQDEDRKLPEQDMFIKTGLTKGFVDGSLGSHTAAFKDYYTDKPDDKGFFINSKANLRKWISNADTKGKHVTVHAIGDEAISSLLDIYEEVIVKNGSRDRRFRIEHVQHIDSNDIARFANLGVIASVQPYHAIDDGRWAEDYIGSERIQTTYAFASLMGAGVKVVFGSDWPVAPGSALDGIYAATTRQTLDGKNPDGWISEQKISAEQALIAYTRDAAYASYEENEKGTLEVGKLADFVVLSENIMTVNPDKIREIQVLQTFVGGKKVFDIEKKK